MAKNSRRTKGSDPKGDTKAEPERSVRSVEPIAPTESAVTPVERDPLGPQGEGDSLPQVGLDQQDPTDDRGSISGDGLSSEDLTVDDRATELEDRVDEGFNADDLDEFMERTGAGGGADGRNPANDAGGLRQPTDEVPGDFDSPIGGNPHRGLEGASGKLPPHQQAYLDQLKSDAQAASDDGDYDAANEAAEKTEKYLIEIGQNEAPTVDDGKSDYSLITNFGSGTTGPKQVWDDAKGEVVMVDADTETNHRGLASNYKQYRETGTNASGNQDTPSPPVGSGLNEDRGVEDDLPDQTPELTEMYHDLKMNDALGGNIDDNPNDDSAGATYDGPPPSLDPTDVVADYGADYNETEADASRVSADDAVPDEEFFDT